MVYKLDDSGILLEKPPCLLSPGRFDLVGNLHQLMKHSGLGITCGYSNKNFLNQPRSSGLPQIISNLAWSERLDPVPTIDDDLFVSSDWLLSQHDQI